MVLGQNYWPESHLAAPSAEALRREVELIKELGFMAFAFTRRSRILASIYWCDRLGLLVWGEMCQCLHLLPTAIERVHTGMDGVLTRDRIATLYCDIVFRQRELWCAESGMTRRTRDYLRALYHLNHGNRSVSPGHWQ
jgi:hypothetical protein